jgi:transposase
MFNVGLDVGDNCSSIEILDEHGKQFKHLEVKGRWPVMLQRIEKEVPKPFAICFEASSGYGYLHDRLSKVASRVEVAHPGQLRLIFKSKRKHNRVDSQKLAKLLFLDEVPRAWVPKAEVRSWRMTIEWRQKLLGNRISTKNRIRSLLKGQGIEAPKQLWSKKGLAWLNALELGEAQALLRDMMVDQLQDLNEKIRRVEKHLKKVADSHPGVTLLRTIPGVGIRTAEAFVAYVDDIARFRRIKQVGTYFGLVPCQDSTGNFNRLGHITRDGPATVRKLVTEAAWQGVRRSKTIRAFFERVKHDDPKRKKIALVATAHYLTRVMAAMLRSGESWREKDQSDQKQKAMTVPTEVGTDGCDAPLRKTPDA